MFEYLRKKILKYSVVTYYTNNQETLETIKEKFIKDRLKKNIKYSYFNIKKIDYNVYMIKSYNSSYIKYFI